MKNIILSISVFFILFSCIKNEEPKKLSRNNELRLEIFGRGHQDAFSVLFNIASDSKDTLYVLGTKYENGKEISENNSINLNKAEVDTLFYYFQKVSENFKIDEGSEASDGTNVRITIANSGNMVSYFYSGLSRAGDASPHINNLVNFINRKLPKNRKIY